MAASSTDAGFTDAEWAVWGPLIEAVRPRGKTLPHELRQTIAAIFWRHRNGARWRAIPTELGPWWRAAQLFIRWARHGAWERLLGLAQERAGGLALSLAFLDGTNVRAHAKAAGAPPPSSHAPCRRMGAWMAPPKKGEQAQAEISVKRLVALAAASAPRP